MADREKSEIATREPSSTVLESAISVLQIRQLAEQEIHRTNEALERRTRELAQALAIMLMFSTGFSKGMRRQLVDMADWLLSGNWSNCMAATLTPKAAE